MKSPAFVFVFASLLVLPELRSDETATDGKSATAKPPASAPAAPVPAKPISRAAEILKRFDKNGDGKLDDDEKADAHETMLQEQMAKEAATAPNRGLGAYQALALELFDRNHDGRLDENERLDALAFVQQRTDGAMRETLLKRFDKNNDGILDEAERRESETYVEEHRGELMQDVLLKRFDKNANGQLDPDEKETIRAAFAKSVAVAGQARGPSVSPAPEEDERAAVQSYFQTHGTELFREEVLRRFDANGNGQIDPDERRVMQDYTRDHPGEILRAVMLKRFDQNGDGRLDETERTAMREVLKAAAAREGATALGSKSQVPASGVQQSLPKKSADAPADVTAETKPAIAAPVPVPPGPGEKK